MANIHLNYDFLVQWNLLDTYKLCVYNDSYDISIDEMYKVLVDAAVFYLKR